VHLLYQVKPLDHEFLPLLLSLTEEVRSEDDLRLIQGEHLELVLDVILSVFNLDFKYPNIISSIAEILLYVCQQLLAHFDLWQTRLEGLELCVFIGLLLVIADVPASRYLLVLAE